MKRQTTVKKHSTARAKTTTSESRSSRYLRDAQHEHVASQPPPKTATAVPAWDLRFQLAELAAEKNALSKLNEDELVTKAKTGQAYLADLTKYAGESAQRSVVEVLRIGYTMNALREKVPHGEWAQFTETHFPNIPTSTEARYRKLAEEYPDPKSLPLNLGITQLYRLAGILDPKKKQIEKGGADATRRDYAKRVHTFRREIGAIVDSANVAGIHEDKRRELLNEIPEVIRLLHEFQKLLASKAGEDLQPSSNDDAGRS